MASRLVGLAIRLRRYVWIPLLIGLSGAALPAHAANDCPWMSEATASGLLGGEATGVYVAATERRPAVCTFTQQSAQGERSLQVAVEAVGEPQARLAQAELTCGTDPAPMHAIGNEAIFCTGEDRLGLRSERAVGRVRNQLFTITLATSVNEDQVLTRELLKARIYTASEQIAGNLF